MFSSMHSLALLPLTLLTLVSAQYPDELVGTWVSKARSVETGPKFYDPVADKFTEPAHAGIAYSFTSDGWWEQAYYRSIPNPTTPNCPSAIMQWQHGTYSLPGNGSIILDPISVDGRQLISSPCNYDTAIYTHYDQPIMLKAYAALTDGFHNVPRLNLFEFDGAPIQPLYQAYKPPQMLPTQTLNPTASSSEPTSKVKRDMDRDEHDQWRQKMIKGQAFEHHAPQPDRWRPESVYYVGFGCLAVGTVMYMLPTKL